jgi:hypothetical protein
MGLGVVGVGMIWNALGLGNRGFIFIVLELAIQVLVGMVIFIGVGFALRMTELREMLNRLLRRNADKAKVVA